MLRQVLAVLIAGTTYSTTHAQDWALDYGRDFIELAEINGTRLAYIEMGQGPPLVLVHGAFADFRYWQGVIDALAESHRVFAYSRRDFYPNALDQPASDNPYADRDDLAAFIERLGVGRVHLVGHSRGGHVVLALATARPDLLRSVTTIEGGFLDAGVSDATLAALASFGPIIREANAQFAAGNASEGTRLFLEYALGPEWYGRWSEPAKRIALDNARAFGRRPEAGLSCAETSRISVPTLLMIGSDTPPHLRAMMQGVQSCVPGIETVEIEGASHTVHVDNPREFVEALLEFVGKYSAP